jgi:DNA polymerase-3 subunit epsilon
MDFRQRPLAIVDVETSGDDESRHEILEVGLLVVRQSDLEILDEMSEKVKPHNIATALPEALKLNGYNEKDWRDAKELAEVMAVFSQKTKGAIFTAYNVSFDWAFIKEAFSKTGAPNLMDYHRFDILSLAWYKLGDKLERINLKEVCKFLGVEPEPETHRAIEGARSALKALKKLKESQ